MAGRTGPRRTPGVAEDPEGSSAVSGERQQAIRETLTMGLYLTISVLAVLVALPPGEKSTVGVLALVWGTTMGLLLAHLLAFRLAARLFSGAALGRHDRLAMLGQGLSALVVATFASLPLLLAEGESALDGMRLLLAGGIGVFAYLVGRREAGPIRAVVYAVGVVVVALVVAVVKNTLAGH